MRRTLRTLLSDSTNSFNRLGLAFCKVHNIPELTCGIATDNDETILACEDSDAVAVRAMRFIPLGRLGISLNVHSPDQSSCHYEKRTFYAVAK